VLALAPEQFDLLKVVYRAFGAVGRWPNLDYVRTMLEDRRGCEFDETTRAMPDHLILLRTPAMPDSEVNLTMLGVACVLRHLWQSKR
jgi:hypothetical protein